MVTKMIRAFQMEVMERCENDTKEGMHQMKRPGLSCQFGTLFHVHIFFPVVRIAQ